MSTQYSFCLCGNLMLDRKKDRKSCFLCSRNIFLQWEGEELTNYYYCASCKYKFHSATVSPVKICQECGWDAFSMQYGGKFFNSLRRFSEEFRSLCPMNDDSLVRKENLKNRLAATVVSCFIRDPTDYHNPEVQYEMTKWSPNHVE